MTRQDPDLAASVVAMLGRDAVYRKAVTAFAHLTIMATNPSKVTGYHAMLAATIAEAALSLDQLAAIVRQHSGTDETMDEARAGARSRLVRQVTKWRGDRPE